MPEANEEAVEEVVIDEIETEETEEGEREEQEDDSEEESDDIVVTIGDEEPEPQEEAPIWVKELRKKNKELARQNKELQKQVAPQSNDSTIVVGKKPSMEDDGIDYDAEKFEEAFEAWQSRKLKFDQQQKEIEEEKKAQDKAWEQTLKSYADKKQSLGVADFDDAEEVVLENLNDVQQGVILHGATDPALVVYALGRNPKKAKELSEIKDNVKFAFAVAKLEAQLKVSKRKPTTKPEKTVKGGGSTPTNTEGTLAKLREEAERTGDFSKVVAFKKKNKG